MIEEHRRSNSCDHSPIYSSISVSSPSRYCSRSRIPSKIRSCSASHSVDAYQITGVGAGKNSPSPSPERILDGEKAEKFQDHLIKEISRPKSKTDHRGRVTGYGNWYDRKLHTYSNAEFIAPQGHDDCVRTVDCMPPDQDKRELGDEDYLLESDWEKCTIIEPKFYWERNKDECCICNSKRASRKGSGRNDKKSGK